MQKWILSVVISYTHRTAVKTKPPPGMPYCQGHCKYLNLTFKILHSPTTPNIQATFHPNSTLLQPDISTLFTQQILQFPTSVTFAYSLYISFFFKKIYQFCQGLVRLQLLLWIYIDIPVAIIYSPLPPSVIIYIIFCCFFSCDI